MWLLQCRIHFHIFHEVPWTILLLRKYLFYLPSTINALNAKLPCHGATLFFRIETVLRRSYYLELQSKLFNIFLIRFSLSLVTYNSNLNGFVSDTDVIFTNVMFRYQQQQSELNTKLSPLRTLTYNGGDWNYFRFSNIFNHLQQPTRNRHNCLFLDTIHLFVNK